MPQRSGSQAPEPRGSSAGGASTNSAGSPSGGSGGGGSAAKQRLRWTPELHERFVDAVTQLGGPDSACFSPSITPLLSTKSVGMLPDGCMNAWRLQECIPQ